MGLQRLGDDSESSAAGMAGRPDDNGRLSLGQSPDSTGVSHRHHLFIAGFVGGLMGQVSGATIR